MKTNRHSDVISKHRMFWIIMGIVVVLMTFSSCGEEKAVTEQQSKQLIPPPPLPPPPPPPDTADPETLPYDVVDVMPAFPGGDSALVKYIADNTKYPDAAKEKMIQGKVIVRFCVTAKGEIDQVSLLRGVSPDIDSEAIRVINTLPSFKPGEKDGKTVPVWYVVPITFALE